jgi:hypothetical protein
LFAPEGAVLTLHAPDRGEPHGSEGWFPESRQTQVQVAVESVKSELVSTCGSGYKKARSVQLHALPLNLS